MRHGYVTVLALAALGGCGEGKELANERADGITLAEWAKRAENLCEQNATRADRGVLRLTREARAEQMAKTEYAARVLELSARQTAPLLDELAAMPPPRGREQQAADFVAHVRKALVLFRRSARALRSHDDQAARDVNMAILEEAVPARELARELEIEGCIPSRSR